MKLIPTPKWMRRRFGRAIRRHPEMWAKFAGALKVTVQFENKRRTYSRFRRSGYRLIR